MRQHFDFTSIAWLTAVTVVLVLNNYTDAEEKEVAEMAPSDVHSFVTDEGVRFWVLGSKPNSPAPTLIHMASNGPDTLADDSFMHIGSLLASDGYLSVSLDLPNHGDEEQARGNTGSIVGWRRRIEAGDNFLPNFAKAFSSVIDTLIRENYSDPARLTICGTSRGGFIALHCAAMEPRIRNIVCFSPVTDLRALREFKGMDNDLLTTSLSTEHLADQLVDRNIWICIGNEDDRVSTESSIITARAYSHAALNRKQIGQVWLHVMPSSGHYTPKLAHEMAAAWARDRDHCAP